MIYLYNLINMNAGLEEITKKVLTKYIDSEEKINKIIKKIKTKYEKKYNNLGPNLDDIMNKELSIEPDFNIYTDGACNKNGKATAVAGFGIFIDKWINNKEIKLNKKIEKVEYKYKNDTHNYYPSNIRAEGWAIYYSLLLIQKVILEDIDVLNDVSLIYKHNTTKKFTKVDYIINIITDSEFWINVITKWYKGWKSRDVLHEKKNIDIVIQTMNTIEILETNGFKINFIHIDGHPEKKTKKENFTKEQMGNFTADELAVKAKEYSDYSLHIVNEK